MNKKLYVDLDYTLGAFNAATGEWVLYDQVPHALSVLSRKIELTLLTANTAANAARFFASFPELREYFSAVIACEDFAPHFIRIGDEHKSWVLANRIDAHENFLSFVHKLWSESPERALPDGALSEEQPPLAYDEWERKVYFPLIAPNKARICGTHGLLIDDEFGNPKPNPIYATMIKDRRAFFAGSRGGQTPTTGPRWNEILNSVLEVLT